MKNDMSSVVEEDAKGRRVAYKDMHTLYEAEQKRADKLSKGEAIKELGNEENSDWVRKQLKKALDPKDRDTVEV
jgi:hypothetical protein